MEISPFSTQQSKTKIVSPKQENGDDLFRNTSCYLDIFCIKYDSLHTLTVVFYGVCFEILSDTYQWITANMSGHASERKFAEGLQRKGNAAKIRETVSQALRDSAIQVKN